MNVDGLPPPLRHDELKLRQNRPFSIFRPDHPPVKKACFSEVRVSVILLAP